MTIEIIFRPHGAPARFPRAAMVQWLVAEGDYVEAGTPVCRYEIDKTVADIEAPASGYLRRIMIPMGARFGRGYIIALMADTPEETIPNIAAKTPEEFNGRGFDWSEIDNYGGPPEPLGVMRRAIAERMAMSKRHIPCFYLTVAVDMSSCIERRNAMRKDGRKATYNDMAIRAAALALARHPKVASVFTPEGVAPRSDFNIGFAAALPDDGLVVPVVKNADRKSLSDIAGETRELAERAKKGRLTPNDCSGGVFSVSYLGSFEVDNFVAIVNPGEAAIAAVGKTCDTPVAVDGRVEIRPVAKITLSADHRSIDGALAARFMTEYKALMENAGEL